MTYFYAHDITDALGTAARLATRSAPRPLLLPHDGSRTAAALHDALAGWSTTLDAADASIATTLHSLSAFLDTINTHDSGLAGILQAGLE